MAKAYAKNKTELIKELRKIGVVPTNIRKLKTKYSTKPWFSFSIK